MEVWRDLAAKRIKALSARVGSLCQLISEAPPPPPPPPPPPQPQPQPRHLHSPQLARSGSERPLFHHESFRTLRPGSTPIGSCVPQTQATSGAQRRKLGDTASKALVVAKRLCDASARQKTAILGPRNLATRTAAAATSVPAKPLASAPMGMQRNGRNNVCAAISEGTASALYGAMGASRLSLFSRAVCHRMEPVSATHGFKGSIVDVKFDPTGTRPLLVVGAASGGDSNDTATQQHWQRECADPTAKLFDYAVGREWKLDKHDGNTVSEVAFTNDGTRVITAGYDGRMCVWNVANIGGSEVVQNRRVHRIAVCPACGPDVVAVVTGREDSDCDVWLVSMGDDFHRTCVFKHEAFCNEVTFMGASLTNWIVGAFDSCVARAKDVSCGGADSATFVHPNNVSTVCCCTRSCLLATGDDHGVHRLWDPREYRKWAAECVGTGYDLNNSSFSPCETLLQGSSDSGCTMVFDLRNFSAPLHRLEHERGSSVLMSKWSSSGVLFSCGSDATVRLWDVKRNSPLVKVIRSHPGPVNCVDVSFDETLAVSGCDGRRVVLHSVSHGQYDNSDSADRFVGICEPLRLAVL